MDPGMLRRARERAALSQAELARRAGTSQSAVSRYESGLADPSLATLERLLAAAGARLDVVVAPRVAIDVRGPAMALVRQNRAAIRAAARSRGATSISVFGSAVRGEDRPDSDIDFLVDLDVRRVGLVPLEDLRIALEDILHRPVDVAARQLLADHVAPSALDEAVPV